MPVDRSLPLAERARIERRFRHAVNLSAAEIAAHLGTEASRAVGFRYPGERESVGRQSARAIIRLLTEGPRTDDDWRHMRKVAGYVARHLAQRPSGDVHGSRWRASLMNWGHDPTIGKQGIVGAAKVRRWAPSPRHRALHR